MLLQQQLVSMMPLTLIPRAIGFFLMSVLTYVWTTQEEALAIPAAVLLLVPPVPLVLSRFPLRLRFKITNFPIAD